MFRTMTPEEHDAEKIRRQAHLALRSQIKHRKVKPADRLDVPSDRTKDYGRGREIAVRRRSSLRKALKFEFGDELIPIDETAPEPADLENFEIMSDLFGCELTGNQPGPSCFSPTDWHADEIFDLDDPASIGDSYRHHSVFDNTIIDPVEDAHYLSGTLVFS